MNTIGKNLSPILDSMKKETDQNLQVQTNSSNLQVRQSKNAEMELTTKEGDKVTLSFSSEASSGYSTYNQKGKIDGTSWNTSETSMYAESESSFEIKIEGDLNKEELNDIMKAVKKLEKAMDKMVRGDMDGAVNSLLDAADGKTISAFESTMTYSKSIAMEKTYEQTYLPGTTDESPVEQPDQEEVINQEQPIDTAGTPPVDQTAVTPEDEAILPKQPETTMTDAIQKLVEDLKETANKSRIPDSVLRPSFENFFDKKIENAEKHALKDSGIIDFFKQIRKELLEGLIPNKNKMVNEVE